MRLAFKFIWLRAGMRLRNATPGEKMAIGCWLVAVGFVATMLAVSL